jgi:hypothetical protein
MALFLFLLTQGHVFHSELSRYALIRQQLIYPRGYLQKKVTVDRIDDQVIYYADNAEQACGYSPFPCTPYRKDELQLRGDALSDGFMILP